MPLAFLAYTGLETVANLAEEARQPGRDLPRSLFAGIGAVVLVTVLIALVALSAFPAPNGTTELGTTWLKAPLMGVVYALGPHIAYWLERVLRVYVGLTGALILLTAAVTSNSGFGRLAFSLAEHGQLPRRFGRLSRRSLHSPETVVAAATISIVLLAASEFTSNPVGFLASLFSFGVLVAFTAAQLAVVKLRFSKPALERPFRVPLSVRVRGADVPLPTVLGALATTAIFVAAMVTHIGARYGGPIWLACGIVVYLLVRRGRGTGLLEHVEPVEEAELPHAEFSKILVPMKLGEIGEEMVATAVKLAQERGADVVALHVIRVPLDQPLDSELYDQEERAAGVARGGSRARGRPRRHGRGTLDPRAVDRRGDRAGGRGDRRRPDRPRLLAALAPPVALLLADRRLRPAQGARRGARRRLPPGRARRGVASYAPMSWRG